MRLEVFSGFELTDMILEFAKFERERKYAGAGDFTLTLNSLDYVDRLKRDNYLVINNDCYVIENVHKFKNEEKKTELEVTGRHLNSILERRVVASFTLGTGSTYEAQIYSLVDQNFINPTDSDRKIPFMRATTSKGLTVTPTESRTLKNKNVLEILEDLCSTAGLGFRVNFLPEDAQMEFEVYQGNDLTEDVFFSEDFGNISESELYEQGNDYKNVGYLNNDGVLTEVGSATGLDRREIILDGDDTAEVTTELEASTVLTSAECAILLTEQFVYREDWDLGDIVAFIDNSLGFLVEKPVQEVTETYTDKLEIDVVFGDRIPTVFEKLKKG